jgi:hypothetical protein
MRFPGVQGISAKRRRNAHQKNVVIAQMMSLIWRRVSVRASFVPIGDWVIPPDFNVIGSSAGTSTAAISTEGYREIIRGEAILTGSIQPLDRTRAVDANIIPFRARYI